MIMRIYVITRWCSTCALLTYARVEFQDVIGYPLSFYQSERAKTTKPKRINDVANTDFINLKFQPSQKMSTRTRGRLKISLVRNLFHSNNNRMLEHWKIRHSNEYFCWIQNSLILLSSVKNITQKRRKNE